MLANLEKSENLIIDKKKSREENFNIVSRSVEKTKKVKKKTISDFYVNFTAKCTADFQ